MWPLGKYGPNCHRYQCGDSFICHFISHMYLFISYKIRDTLRASSTYRVGSLAPKHCTYNNHSAKMLQIGLHRLDGFSSRNACSNLSHNFGVWMNKQRHPHGWSFLSPLSVACRGLSPSCFFMPSFLMCVHVSVSTTRTPLPLMQSPLKWPYLNLVTLIPHLQIQP